MSSIDTNELIKKPYEEAANKSSEIVAKMVTELQATGLIITEEMVKTIIAPKAIEIFMTGYKFGVDMGSKLTIEQINNTIEHRLSNCEAKKLNDIYQIAFKTGVNAGIVGYEQKLREYFAKYAEKDSSGYIKLLANILTECFEEVKNDNKCTEQ